MQNHPQSTVTSFRKQDSDSEEEGYEMIQEPYESESLPNIDMEYSYQDIISNSKTEENLQHSPSFHGLRNELPQQRSVPHSQKQNSHSNDREESVSTETLSSFPGLTPNSNRTTRSTSKSPIAGVELLNSDDFIKQMSLKIRKQAERIMQLENYKGLCETRLKEVSPNHSIPVLESHLGSPAESSQSASRQQSKQLADCISLLKKKDEEIYTLQQEISSLSTTRKSPNSLQESHQTSLKRDEFIPQSDDMTLNYNILYGKYRALLKEKEQLEFSLRKETASNEERRAYTEVLKQMLEEKFDANGLPASMSDGKRTLSRIDFFCELRKAINRAEAVTQETVLVTSRLRERENEIYNLKSELEKLQKKGNDLTRENLQLSENNIKINQLVKDFESEVKKLETEKSNLLDYIEKHKLDEMSNSGDQSHSQNNAGIEILKEQIETLRAENEALRAENEELWNVENDDKEPRNNQRAQKVSEQLTAKNREIDQLRNQINRLVEDIGKLNEEVRLKTTESSNRKQNKGNENRLVERINELTTQDEALQTTISQISQKLYDSETQLNYYQQAQTELQNEIAQLKDVIENQKIGLSEIKYDTGANQNYSTVLKDRNDGVEAELIQVQEKLEKAMQRLHELNLEKLELQEKVQAQKNEIDSYESLLNESKVIVEKERQDKKEVVRKQTSQNQGLKAELVKVREDLEQSQQEINMKADELRLLRELLDKRSSQNRALAEENRSLRLKSEEYETIRSELERTRSDSGKTIMELKEYENHIFNRNEDIRQIRQKLESTEYQLLDTAKSLKELQQEKGSVKSENRRLLDKINDLEHEIKRLNSRIRENDTFIVNSSAEAENLTKRIFKQEKDTEILEAENRKLFKENKSLQESHEERIKAIMLSNEKLNETLVLVRESFSSLFQLVENSDGQTTLLSNRIKEVMTQLANYYYKAPDEQVLVKLSETMQEVSKSFLQELEAALRKIIDQKQELSIAHQKVSLLEKKCLHLSNEEKNAKSREESLRYEIEALRETKLQQIGAATEIRIHNDVKTLLEQENNELRSELENLVSQVQTLKAKRTFVPEALSDEPHKRTIECKKTACTESSSNSETLSDHKSEVKVLEEKFTVLNREKKSIEELLDRVTDLIANPDIKKLIADILRMQTDVSLAEREKQRVETKLTDLEADFKLLIKRNLASSPSESQGLRSEIDELRNELNNINSQLSILKKRKMLLLDELKTFEHHERRRFESTVQTEKALLLARKEIQEFKIQNNTLCNMNGDLKDAFKTVAQEKKVLDYENVRLKYMATIQNKENYPPIETFASLEGSDLPLQKQSKAEPGTDEVERIEKSVQKPPQERNIETPNYSLYRRTDAIQENVAGAGQIVRGNSQLKLKERLSQAKSVINSAKKSLDNDNSRLNSCNKPPNSSMLKCE